MPALYRVHDANVAWRVADDEAVLLHADTSAYFGLNPTGTILWVELAEHPMSLSQLTTWARSCFPDAPASLPEELSTFLDQLLEFDLIEPEESPGPSDPVAPRAAMKGASPPAWETPAVERFGELEKLILSGE